MSMTTWYHLRLNMRTFVPGATKSTMEFWVNLAIALFGIALSLGFGFLGWRLTIGAAEVRRRQAEDEVLSILLKRMVLDDYTPQYHDISQMLDGVSRRREVRRETLIWEEEVLASLYFDAVANDLIAPDHRQNIVSRLDGVVPDSTSELELPERTHDEWTPAILFIVPVGIAIVVLSALVAGLTGMFAGEEYADPTGVIFGVVTSVSALTMFIAYFIRQYRSVRRHNQRRTRVMLRRKRHSQRRVANILGPVANGVEVGHDGGQERLASH